MDTINQITVGLIKTITKLVTLTNIIARNNYKNNFTIRKNAIRVKLKCYKNINKKCNDFFKSQKNNNKNKKYEEKIIITCSKIKLQTIPEHT